jgi:GNAT superfamily N-acetyltransferase
MTTRVATTQADAELCVEINNAVNPDTPVTADQLDVASGAFIVHGDVGYAYVDRSTVPDAAYAMVRVRQEARRRGSGSALMTAARARARELGCESMWGRVHEADAESLAFVASRGFEEVTRDVVVVLEVAPGDGEVAPGIVELRDEHMRGAYEVAAECLPEMALPQHAEAPPFEQWVADGRRRCPVAFVALDGDDVVGYAQLRVVTAVPDRLENGLTAVRKGHRRRGVATALKRAQIAWAGQNGYREIVTSMVEGNAAMRAVNARLGYERAPERLPAFVVVRGPVQ